MAEGPTLTIRIEDEDADGSSAVEHLHDRPPLLPGGYLGGVMPGRPVAYTPPAALPAPPAPAAQPQPQSETVAPPIASPVGFYPFPPQPPAAGHPGTFGVAAPPVLPGQSQLQYTPTYQAMPPPQLPGQQPAPLPNAGTTVRVDAEVVNESAERTVETIKRLRLANDELKTSLADGTYLKQTRELVRLRREESQLMKESARTQTRAQYGAVGAAGREAVGAATGTFGWLNRQEQTAGQIGVQAIQNNGLGAVTAASGAAASGLMQLGKVGGMAGMALQAATSAATAFGQFVSATVARGRELQFASGDLAGATAAADVTSYLADIREASYLGKDMAEMIRQQSELSREWREVMLPIKKVAIEMGSGLLITAREFLHHALAFLKDTSWMPDAFRDYAKRVLAALESPQVDANALMEDFRNSFDVDADWWPALPAAAQMGGGLGLPILSNMVR